MRVCEQGMIAPGKGMGRSSCFQREILDCDSNQRDVSRVGANRQGPMGRPKVRNSLTCWIRKRGPVMSISSHFTGGVVIGGWSQ
jgi:hypothetical protein